MADDHPGGFLAAPRAPIGKRDAAARIHDYDEVWKPKWENEHLREQGKRCMDCGIPTCMGGCPIGNIIPDWNDLVSRGEWRAALARLHATNNFPEFTGYTCPAPCENACTLAINTGAVTIKSIERAIVDRGWEEGWIVPEKPHFSTGKSIAIVGSGPAGLSAAQQLNRAGHAVTVYERADAIGGLMVYGIPDFKFAKKQVTRRVDQMTAEGVTFETGQTLGRNLVLADLQKDHDAVCLAIGAQKPRDVQIPGRELGGVVFAMDFLTQENRHQAGRDVTDPITAKGKSVVVLGGGDTGADCVATALRQGATEVIQVSINVQKPLEREPKNPWPEQPVTYSMTYAIEEGGVEEFSADAAAFVDTDGDGVVNEISMDRVEWTYDDYGRRVDKKIIEKDFRVKADLVLLAIGFSGSETGALEGSGIELTKQNTIAIDQRMMTNVEGVFAAGDANRGQSIVVWAIGEGRDAARKIDEWLMGRSLLPPSLRTVNPPNWK
ncbi:MAG: glutamate synthase subunit beta [Chthoniobacterales bacterium]